MTDERMGERLWIALRRLPPGSGVVVRHRSLPAAERRALLRRIRRIAQARRLTVSAAGLWGAQHGGRIPFTAAAHDRREAIAAARAGARYLFVSPIYPTRSHPGAPALGPRKAATVARGLGVDIIALGGMDARRWRRLRHLGFTGWAGIDALTP